MKRTPLKGNDEHDALTGWRRVLKFRPGQRKKAKRKYNKRFRKVNLGGPKHGLENRWYL